MSNKIQAVIALALVLGSLVPSSAFAEERSRQRTNLERLAADLERVLGNGSARVEGRRASTTTTAREPETVLRRDARDVILEAMNRERVARGLHPLRINEALSKAASDRAGDMFAKRYFAHVSPDGIQPFVWATQRGYRYRLIGENLAVGFRGAAVVDGWMKSPGHRENILQRGFEEVGLAIAEGSPRNGYRGPLVVAMYGAR